MEEEYQQDEERPSHRGRWILFVCVGVIVLAGIVWYGASRDETINTAIELPDVSRVTEGQVLKLTFLNHVVLEQGHYEAWVTMDGEPVSVEKFKIRADGKMVTLHGDPVSFSELDAGQDISSATDIFISIEPDDDTDDTPSDVVFLRGTVNPETSTAILSNAAGDFSSVSGRYIVSTPTDASNDDETSGVWFLTAAAAAGSPETRGLTLPTLADHWVYQGWVRYQGGFMTLGRFVSVEGADDFSGYSGTTGTSPAFPGEDFLTNAPPELGVTFPIDLTADGTTEVQITIEPDVGGTDITGTDVFEQPVLFGYIPADARTDVNYDLTSATTDLTTATAVLR